MYGTLQAGKPQRVQCWDTDAQGPGLPTALPNNFPPWVEGHFWSEAHFLCFLPWSIVSEQLTQGLGGKDIREHLGFFKGIQEHLLFFF